MQNTTVFLSIRNGGKGIPYGGASEDRPDGSTNHGFKPLKSNPEEIGAIPEAQGIGALTRALAALDAADSPFLTVGCEKAFGSNDIGTAGCKSAFNTISRSMARLFWPQMSAGSP